MTAIEGAVVVVLVVAATVASVLGGLTPALAGIIGTALGYAGGRVATSGPLISSSVTRIKDDYTGAPDA